MRMPAAAHPDRLPPRRGDRVPLSVDAEIERWVFLGVSDGEAEQRLRERPCRRAASTDRDASATHGDSGDDARDAARRRLEIGV
jgi:hypothetical protein